MEIAKPLFLAMNRVGEGIVDAKFTLFSPNSMIHLQPLTTEAVRFNVEYTQIAYIGPTSIGQKGSRRRTQQHPSMEVSFRSCPFPEEDRRAILPSPQRIPFQSEGYAGRLWDLCSQR